MIQIVFDVLEQVQVLVSPLEPVLLTYLKIFDSCFSVFYDESENSLKFWCQIFLFNFFSTFNAI